jgi:hypothetical protein
MRTEHVWLFWSPPRKARSSSCSPPCIPTWDSRVSSAPPVGVLDAIGAHSHGTCEERSVHRHAWSRSPLVRRQKSLRLLRRDLLGPCNIEVVLVHEELGNSLVLFICSVAVVVLKSLGQEHIEDLALGDGLRRLVVVRDDQSVLAEAHGGKNVLVIPGGGTQRESLHECRNAGVEVVAAIRRFDV